MLITDKTQYARFNQAQVKAALSLWSRTGILPHRGATLTKLLAQAGRHTGKTYPRSRMGAAAATNDLTELLKC